MKRSRPWMCVAILAVALLSLSGWLYLGHIDPRYNGRRTSEWLRALESKSETEKKDAELAIFVLGERAIPQITKFFYAQDSEGKLKVFYWFEKKFNREIPNENTDTLRILAERAVALIGKRAGPMVPRLIASLDDDDLSGYALSALGSIGEPAIPDLKNALASNNSSKVKAAVVQILFEAKQADIVPHLRSFVSDSNSDLRAVSIVALVLFDKSREESLSFVQRLLKDQNDNVREHAVEALGYLAQFSPELIPSFCAFIHDSSAYVRMVVVKRFPDFYAQDTSAFDVLRVALVDAEPAIRSSMHYSLCSAMGAADFIRPAVCYERLRPDSNWHLALPHVLTTGRPELVFVRREELIPVIESQKNYNSGVIVMRGPPPVTLGYLARLALLFLDPKSRPATQEVMKIVGGARQDYVSNDPRDNFYHYPVLDAETAAQIRKVVDELRLKEPKMAEALSLACTSIYALRDFSVRDP